MARNDIRFAQANQADFGQANALYLQSMQALNNAVTGLQDTAKTFGDAVTKKNTATAKDMINQLSFDDWNNPEKRQQLQQDLQAFNDRMGNAVHFDEIVKHKQDNYQRLLQDSNAYYQNKQNQAIAVKDDLARQELERNHRVMETFGQVYDIDNQLNALTKDDPKRQELISQKDTLLSSLTGLDRQNYDRNSLLWKTEQNKANYDYNQSNLLSVQDEIKFNAGLLALKRYELSQTTDETAKQLLNQDIQKLNTKIANLSLSTGNPYGGLNYSDEQELAYHNTNIQPNIDKAIKAQQVLDKAIAEQTEKDRRYNLDVYKAVSTNNYQQGQLGVAQQNANTGQFSAQVQAEKTAAEIVRSQYSSNQSGSNSVSKSGNKDTQTALGNSLKSDGTIDAEQFKTHLFNSYDAILNETSTAPISDADYLNWKTKDFPKQDNLTGWDLGNRGVLLNLLDNHKKPNGKLLTNAEKVKIASHIVSNGVPFSNDNKTKAIDDTITHLTNNDTLHHSQRFQQLTKDITDNLTSLNIPMQSQIELIRQTFPQDLLRYLPTPYQKGLQAVEQQEKEKARQHAIKNFTLATLTTFGNRVPNKSNSRGVPYKN